MNTHIKADSVNSPKRHWVLLKVLVDLGEEEIAIAIGRWDETVRLAIRWNGEPDNPIGTPQSRGLPTWFMLPASGAKGGGFTDAIFTSLPQEERDLAKALGWPG